MRGFAGNLLLGGRACYRAALALAPTDADRTIVERQLKALLAARQT